MNSDSSRNRVELDAMKLVQRTFEAINRKTEDEGEKSNSVGIFTSV